MFRISQKTWANLVIVLSLLPWPTSGKDWRHGGPVTSIAHWTLADSSQGFLSGGFDGRILAWSGKLEALEQRTHHPTPIEKLSTFSECEDCPNDIVISPPMDHALNFRKGFGSKGIVEIERTGMARLIGVEQLQLPGHFSAPLDIDLRHQRLLAIERNLPPQLIDLKTHETSVLPVGGIAVSAGRLINEQFALLGTVDGYVNLVSLDTLEIVAREQAHPAPVLAIDVADRSSLAITAGANGAVTAWQVSGNSLAVDRILAQYDFPIIGLLLDETNARVIIGHKDGRLVALPLTGEAKLGSPPKPAVLFARSQDDDTGAKLFRACAACHSFSQDGSNKAGPTFAGLFGRKAGTVPGYPYSDALLNSGIVWTAQTLSELFEQGPQHYLPGTTMPLQRLANDADRALLIDYIKAQDLQFNGRQKP